jgi:caa(3)-type oxidase subunit IV
MISVAKPSVSYVTIWVWLVLLVGVGLAVLVAPVSKLLSIILIFSVATVKATLVLRHYMHVRAQPLMIYAMICVPLILAIALIITLMPDIAFRP